MNEISFEQGITDTFGSLMSYRLALLAGAGLSMPKPSALPSAAVIAASAKLKYDALFAPPPLPVGIEDQAEYFFGRHELDTVYFRTLIDPSAFAGEPNEGHYAVADLLLTQIIQAAVTTNVDSLIEVAGNMLRGQIGACIDGLGAASQPLGTIPLLKIHGCRTQDRPNMVWAPSQIATAPVSDRIASSATWLNGKLLDKDLLIVGYWTDWDYLNSILVATLGAVNPARVTVVDPADIATFQTKAPELFSIGQKATSGFRLVRASGAAFLAALRRQFSRAYIRRLLYQAAEDFSHLKGFEPHPDWMEPADLDNQTLWQIRGDLEGRLPNKPVLFREPPEEPLLGLTMLQLRAAGGQVDGPYWKIGSLRVRVLRTALQALHKVQAEFEGETPPTIAPDLVIAVGAEAQSLPSNFARAGTAPTIARGSSGRWLSRPDALQELGI